MNNILENGPRHGEELAYCIERVKFIMSTCTDPKVKEGLNTALRVMQTCGVRESTVRTGHQHIVDAHVRSHIFPLVTVESDKTQTKTYKSYTEYLADTPNSEAPQQILKEHVDQVASLPDGYRQSIHRQLDIQFYRKMLKSISTRPLPCITAMFNDWQKCEEPKGFWRRVNQHAERGTLSELPTYEYLIKQYING